MPYTVTDYLKQTINFGGEVMSLGRAIKIMQDEGHAQVLIDRWVQGALLSKRLQDSTHGTK